MVPPREHDALRRRRKSCSRSWLVCPVWGKEKVVETQHYEPRFQPHPSPQGADASASATIHQLSLRGHERPTRRAAWRGCCRRAQARFFEVTVQFVTSRNRTPPERAAALTPTAARKVSSIVRMRPEQRRAGLGSEARCAPTMVTEGSFAPLPGIPPPNPVELSQLLSRPRASGHWRATARAANCLLWRRQLARGVRLRVSSDDADLRPAGRAPAPRAGPPPRPQRPAGTGLRTGRAASASRALRAARATVTR